MQQADQSYSKTTIATVAVVKDEIDKNPLSPKSTDELAALAGMTRARLQKIFKDVEGKRIRDYQFDRKMGAACDMLLEGQFSIKQVALQCGFSSQENFSHSFKKKYKMSPKNWQYQFGGR